MPPRSPALRRRTTPKRAAVHVSNLGIWMTDAMLMHAVEQYQIAIAATCRRINSHAGPLESRRRASKRHMTGLMPTSHTFPPIWQFDVGPSSLQWEAPTSLEHRRQKRDQVSVSGLFNTIVGWLENQGSTDKNFIPTPASPSEADSGVVRSEALAVDSTPVFVTIPEQKLQEPISSANLPEEIMLLRSSILDMNTVGDDKLFSELCNKAKICRRSLRRRIERGHLSVETLLAALEPLDSASKSRIPTAKMANKISAMIRRGILYAMADVHSKNPAAITHELWLTFVDKLCATNGDNHDIQLFRRLMHIMPTSLKDQFSPEKIRNLTCRVVTAQANRHNLFGHWSALAARFSQALQQLPAQQQRELDHDMTTFLSQQDYVSDNAKRLRYAWLVIKACDASTSTQNFIDVYRSCLGPETRLNGMQRWHVVFARLSALQTFDAESRKQLMQGAYKSSNERWSTLIAHIMLSSIKDGALQELLAVLTGIGEFSSTARVLTLPPLHEIRRDMMEAIAMACANHKQALLLHDSIDMKPRRHRNQPIWSWLTWAKYAEAMIKDPDIDPARIWQVLKLTYTPRGISSKKKLLAEDNEAKSQLLNQIGKWFIEAQHLNDRQVLRSVQRCVNMQRALTKGDVSSQMLAHVVEVISRDLERGQRGRTSRMQWLLNMVSAKHGALEAKKAALAWTGWRWTIDGTQNQWL